MKWGKIFSQKTLNWIGVGLLMACYLVSLQRIFNTHVQAEKPGMVTLRIAHWQLENGLRSTFDQLGAAYTKLHPNVRIEQLPIPERVYPSWLVTQLVGGTAPDLMELNENTQDEYYARYFLPLSDIVEKPNPYNHGTPLETVPWRATFLDGLAQAPAYNSTLLDYYGVGLDIYTTRFYYNRALYEKILGPDAPAPQTYAQLIDVCEKIEAYSRSHNQPLVAIAGSHYNSPSLMCDLFGTQTQKLSLALDTTLTMPSLNGTQLNWQVGLGYLEGRWSLHSPEVVSGLHLMRDVSLHMEPNFMQLARDDATFYFLQQHAVFIATGSWDVRSLTSQATFPIQICAIPMPSPEDPKYGRYVLGPLSEASTSTQGCFGVFRHSPHSAEAIDFLQFITSQEGDTLFSKLSDWLPSVQGIPVPEEVKPFAPNLEGYPAGFKLASDGGAESTRVFNTNAYLLSDPQDKVDLFIQQLEAGNDFRRAIIEDLQQAYQLNLRTLQRSDTAFGALCHIRFSSSAAPADIQRKQAELAIQQSETEILNDRIANGLQAAGAPLKP